MTVMLVGRLIGEQAHWKYMTGWLVGWGASTLEVHDSQQAGVGGPEFRSADLPINLPTNRSKRVWGPEFRSAGLPTNLPTNLTVSLICLPALSSLHPSFV